MLKNNGPFPFAMYPGAYNSLQKAVSPFGGKQKDTFTDSTMERVRRLHAFANRYDAAGKTARADRSWRSMIHELHSLSPKEHEILIQEHGGLDKLYPRKYMHLVPVNLMPDVETPSAAQPTSLRPGKPMR